MRREVPNKPFRRILLQKSRAQKKFRARLDRSLNWVRCLNYAATEEAASLEAASLEAASEEAASLEAASEEEPFSSATAEEAFSSASAATEVLVEAASEEDAAVEEAEPPQAVMPTARARATTATQTFLSFISKISLPYANVFCRRPCRKCLSASGYSSLFCEKIKSFFG
jgi:hypothetical protein